MLHSIAPAGSATFDSALVVQLLSDALAVFDDDRQSARLHLERARTVARGEAVARPSGGLLADWQVRKVERFVDGNIETPLRIHDAASCVNLSASYFSHAFKITMGVPYSHYVIRRRVERARSLLLSTLDPVADIAIACGFADQSHLTRLFGQALGEPPSAWRRRQRAAEPGTAMAS